MDSPAAERINAEFWQAGSEVAEYANRRLLPAEAIIMLRHHEALGRRVLEVGCGAGRMLGYLLALGGEVHGLDVSQAMVDYCRRAYPEAAVRVGDLGDLPATVDGRFDAIVAADNVLDVFDDATRRRVLGDLRAAAVPGGVLVFSSHNLANARAARSPRSGSPLATSVRALLDRSPADLIRLAPRILRRRRNRRRLRRLEQWAGEYAILNDTAHDYSLLHYYIGREQQTRQLAAAGFELLETLELDGTPVGDCRDGRGPSLYYVARAEA
jgi:SAM-dependent methyltransferase